MAKLKNSALHCTLIYGKNPKQSASVLDSALTSWCHVMVSSGHWWGYCCCCFNLAAKVKSMVDHRWCIVFDHCILQHKPRWPTITAIKNTSGKMLDVSPPTLRMCTAAGYPGYRLQVTWQRRLVSAESPGRPTAWTPRSAARCQQPPAEPRAEPESPDQQPGRRREQQQPEVGYIEKYLYKDEKYLVVAHLAALLVGVWVSAQQKLWLWVWASAATSLVYQERVNLRHHHYNHHSGQSSSSIVFQELHYHYTLLHSTANDYYMKRYIQKGKRQNTAKSFEHLPKVKEVTGNLIFYWLFMNTTEFGINPT